MVDENGDLLSRRRRWPWVLGAVAALLILLGVAGALYNLYWQHKVDALLASYRAKGEPVTWEEVLAARKTLPDDENSALVFQRAFALMEPDDDPAGDAVSWVLHDDEPGSRPSPRTVEMLLACVKEQAPVLAIIHEGAALPTGVYPIAPTTSPFASEMPYLGPLQFAGPALRHGGGASGAGRRRRRRGGQPRGGSTALRLPGRVLDRVRRGDEDRCGCRAGGLRRTLPRARPASGPGHRQPAPGIGP